MTSIASTWNSEKGIYDPELRVEFYISTPGAHQYFELLKACKAEIERELGDSLTWLSPTNKQTCRAYIRKSTDFQDNSQWPQQHEWLRENLEKFHRVFSPRVKQLHLSKAVSPDTQLQNQSFPSPK